jgi:ribonuclease P/MRP protein subunit RPP40
MVHGKKGFSRLEWACKNVLNQSLTWLFYNMNPASADSLREGKEPISIHQPVIQTLEPSITHLPNVSVPRLRVEDLSGLYNQEDALALQEYIHMLSLGSPRVRADDVIDPHLSRYEVPDFGLGGGMDTRGMVRIRWRGFIAPRFVKEVFLMVRREGLKVEKKDGEEEGSEERWIALCAGGFGGKKGWTIMQWAGRDTLVWESEI